MAWKVNPDKSKIEFLVRHVQVTTVRGRFKSFEGTLDMNEADPLASSVEGSVDTAGIDTGIGPRDSSLRGPGRFNVQQYPKMTFKSTRVCDFEGDTFKVWGDLTIKDITRPIVIDIVNKGEVPAAGDERRWAFGATFEVNRKDFDIKWNFLMDMLVADEIKGDLDLEFVQE